MQFILMARIAMRVTNPFLLYPKAIQSGMAGNYQPPFTITPTVVDLIAAISEQIGRVAVLDE
ncbi:hypothetical protein AB833_24495 [Chromatiales bacterium (ex Bugula neritina AB1)]|nr:hypothetical protein AB833_24495 [Chromatiales bacterium (ex Bugula neritina AB1)]